MENFLVDTNIVIDLLAKTLIDHCETHLTHQPVPVLSFPFFLYKQQNGFVVS